MENLFRPVNLFQEKASFGPKYDFIKVTRRSPKGESKYEVGRLVSNDCYIEPFPAVVLAGFSGRAKSGMGGKTICRSWDNMNPAPAILEPLCADTPVRQVADTLRKAGLSSVAIKNLEPEILRDKSLFRCAVRNPESGRIIKLCKCSVKSRGESATCKDLALLYLYRLSDGKVFKAELRGQDLWGVAEPKTDSPFKLFQKYLRDEGVKCDTVQVTIGVKPVDDTFLMDFADLKPLEVNEELKVKLAYAGGLAEANFKNISEYVPAEVKAARSKFAETESGPADESEGFEADDDIPWGEAR